MHLSIRSCSCIIQTDCHNSVSVRSQILYLTCSVNMQYKLETVVFQEAVRSRQNLFFPSVFIACNIFIALKCIQIVFGFSWDRFWQSLSHLASECLKCPLSVHLIGFHFPAQYADERVHHISISQGLRSRLKRDRPPSTLGFRYIWLLQNFLACMN